MIRRDQFGRRIVVPQPGPNSESPGPEQRPETPAPQTPQASPAPKSVATEQTEKTEQPEAPASGRPAAVFKTTRVTPDQPASRLPTWMILLGLLVAAGAVAQGVMYWVNRPDPHFVTAQKMVSAYETGRTWEMRNFGNPVYAGALAELNLVDPKSNSARPARDMIDRIERDIRRFEDRRIQAEQQARAARTERDRRESTMQVARTRAILTPQVDYPECEHEDAGEGHKGHQH